MFLLVFMLVFFTPKVHADDLRVTTRPIFFSSSERGAEALIEASSAMSYRVSVFLPPGFIGKIKHAVDVFVRGTNFSAKPDTRSRLEEINSFDGLKSWEGLTRSFATKKSGRILVRIRFGKEILEKSGVESFVLIVESEYQNGAKHITKREFAVKLTPDLPEKKKEKEEEGGQ